jgi:glycosyltransferase involved in cell wall biosynthesis
MRILFVAMPQSEHAVRHISAISEQGWDIHIFPSYETTVLPYFKNITAYHSTSIDTKGFDPSIRIRTLFPNSVASEAYRLGQNAYIYTEKFPRFRRLIRRLKPKLQRYMAWADRHQWLVRIIHETKPDIIHSQTLFNGGNLTYIAREQFNAYYPNERFPKWIVSNWGMDLHFLGQIPEHQSYIRPVLKTCDYFICECERDVEMARSHGFAGAVLPILPIGGGYNIDRSRSFMQPGPPSARRTIAVKGYQNLVGRSLVALRALELNAELLKGYRIAIYLLPADYSELAPYLAQKLGVPVDIIPRQESHDEILKLHGESRFSIGLSISDAISTSLLEAMMMGSLPIQSDTACADEWVTDGKSALIVPAEDPHAVAAAIRRALVDDNLVDTAAEINEQTVRARLENEIIQPQIVNMYKQIISESKTG